MSERTASEEERLFSGYSGKIFIALTFGALVTMLGKHLIPPLLPFIIEDFQITSFQAGLALSLMSAFYALLQFPSGRASDQLTRTTVVIASLLAAVLAFFIISMSVSYPIFLLGAALIGVGRGLFAPAARAFLSDIFKQHRGQAFGLHMISADIAGAGAAGLAITFVAFSTWQSSFVLVIILLLIVIFLIHYWSRESYKLGRIQFNTRSTVSRLFTQRLRWILVAYGLYIFTIRGFIGFLPAFLQADHGFTATNASVAFGVLFVTGMIVKPAAGKLSDRVSRPVVSATAVTFGGLGIGMLVLGPSVNLVVIGVVVYAIGHKAFGPVMQAYLMDLFPDASMGGDLGATRTVYTGFGSLGPMYVGYLGDTLSYTAAFTGFIFCFLICGIIMVWLERTDCNGE